MSAQTIDQPLRLALLHPQRSWADTLERMLRNIPGIEVVVAHTTFKWTRGAVARGDVDVALVGMDDGVFEPQHLDDLRLAWPGLDVVVISESMDTAVVQAVLRAGARGWLKPTASARELVDALYGVRNGQTWLPRDLTTVVLDSLLDAEKRRDTSQEALSRLSAREQEILDCLAQGMSRAQIGDRYLLSPHTVRTHINHVLRKLEVHSTLAAVSLANKSRVPG